MINSALIKSAVVTLSLLMWAQPVDAKVSVTGVTGASFFEVATEDADPVIYGGMAGGDCSSQSSTNTATCDSCKITNGLLACNKKRIYPDLTLTISFRSDSKFGTPMITHSEDTTGTRIGTSGSDSSAVNTTVTASAKWSDICSKLEGGSNTCEGSLTGTLLVGFDEDNDNKLDEAEESISIGVRVHEPGNGDDFQVVKECGTSDSDANVGICDYVAAAGDGKAFIDDPRVGDGSATIELYALRVYMSTDDFICDMSESLAPAELRISETEDDEIQIDNKVIDGLTNGERFYFRISTVDKAQNQFAFMDDSVINENCFGGNSTYSCDTDARDVSSIDAKTCPYIARPDEVLGLLSKDFNCFIATAAFGSPLDARLDVMRKFRSKILGTTKWGRKFVSYYYKQGPYAAKWVRDHQWSRPILQTLLWPVWAFAWMGINWGMASAILISLFTFSGLIFGARYMFRSRPQGAQ